MTSFVSYIKCVYSFGNTWKRSSHFCKYGTTHAWLYVY